MTFSKHLCGRAGICLLLLSVIGLSACQKPAESESTAKKAISISGAWALYPMTIRWTEEYKKIQPDIRFDIAPAGTGKGLADVLYNNVDIGLVSRDITPAEVNNGAFGIAVTKEAFVPTMNANNPFVAQILKSGLKRQTMIDIWINAKINRWNQVLPNLPGEPEVMMNIYTRADSCGAAQSWAEYLGKSQTDLFGVGVPSEPALAEAVKRDPQGIGYDNINYVYDRTTKKLLPGLQVIPIDLNENGQIDPDENFYETRDVLVKAIDQGRYPSPPARDFFFVTKGKPQNPALRNFIRWILSDGQKFVPESGYVLLPASLLQAELKNLE
jgi:phosphate transport system substrate-binding protein